MAPGRAVAEPAAPELVAPEPGARELAVPEPEPEPEPAVLEPELAGPAARVRAVRVLV